MSYETFWYNVRRAATGVFRTDVYFADEPQPDAEEIKTRLRADARWFRASTVAAFESGKGILRTFLADGEPEFLSNSVTEFEEALYANSLDRGVLAFTNLLGVMNFYRYGDPDGFRHGKQVEQLLRDNGEWPDYLHELRFWRATQSDEFLVLSVYAHLKVDVVKDLPGFLAACKELRPLLDDTARAVAPEWFPHVTFRTDEVLPEYANQPDEDESAPAAPPVALLPGAA